MPNERSSVSISGPLLFYEGQSVRTIAFDKLCEKRLENGVATERMLLLLLMMQECENGVGRLH